MTIDQPPCSRRNAAATRALNAGGTARAPRRRRGAWLAVAGVPVLALLGTALPSSAQAASGAVLPATQSATFAPLGGHQSDQLQTFTVPAGVTFVNITSDGGAGGNGSYGIGSLTNPGGSGGAAGRVTGTLAVQPGDTLTMYVAYAAPNATTSISDRANCALTPVYGSEGDTQADAAQYPGGHGGGGDICSGGNGGPGGAATVIWQNSPSGTSTPALVAAGGGGGGGGGGLFDYEGGAGGAVQDPSGTGTDGTAGTGLGFGNGGAASDDAGYSGGVAGGGEAGYSAGNGQFDNGENAGGGGGGGGGYHGGDGGGGGTAGAGGGGGGAGGTSYAGGVIFEQFQPSPLGAGANGQVTLSWQTPISEVFASASPSPAASGQKVQYSATVVSYSGASVPTGDVAFKIGKLLLCKATLVPDPGYADRAIASCGSRLAPAGASTVGAVYPGDVTFLPSTGYFSVTVSPV